MKTKKPSTFQLFTEFWKNRNKIKEILQILSIVISHVRNLIEDLADDGKLNGSNKKDK